MSDTTGWSAFENCFREFLKMRDYLDAERAKVKALREALRSAVHFMRNAGADLERGYPVTTAALAATSDPEPEAPSDVHPQECGQ